MDSLIRKMIFSISHKNKNVPNCISKFDKNNMKNAMGKFIEHIKNEIEDSKQAELKNLEESCPCFKCGNFDLNEESELGMTCKKLNLMKSECMESRRIIGCPDFAKESEFDYDQEKKLVEEKYKDITYINILRCFSDLIKEELE